MLYILFPYKYRKWLTLLGGFLIQLSIGSFLTFGNMIPYIASYLREYDKIDVRYSQIVWIGTSYSVAFSLNTLLCGILTSTFKLNIKLSILFGGIVITLTQCLTYFAIQKSFYLVILTYGIIFGIASGFVYVGPLSIAMKWFPKKIGFSNSVILFGYGASSIIFDQIQTIYINPDNLSPDKPYSPDYPNEKYFSNVDLLNRIPKIFLILGAIYGSLQIIGLGLLAEGKEILREEVINEQIEESEPLISSTINSETNSLGVKYKDPNEGLTLLEASKRHVFWILFFKIFTQLIPCGIVVTFFKTFGQTFIKDDKFLSQVGSIAAIFNALGTFFWGFLIDITSYKMCYLFLSTLLVILTSTLYLVQFMEANFIYVIYVGMVNTCQSGIYVIMPTVIAKTFGLKNFQAIYGAIFFSSLLGSFVIGALGSNSDKFGWFWLFISTSLIALSGWILGFVFNVKQSNGTDI